jgi:hypothetical protein
MSMFATKADYDKAMESSNAKLESEDAMTFDEWFADQIWGNEDFKTCLMLAWEAATATEREACARACEIEYVDAIGSGCSDDVAYNNALEHAAAAIRARSNAVAHREAACGRSGGATCCAAKGSESE